MGSLGSTVGYDSSPYCDVVVKNEAFERIGELGRVHSYEPTKSLRFWSGREADEAGHDAGIMDLFRAGPEIQKRGKVNVNTETPSTRS